MKLKYPPGVIIPVAKLNEIIEIAQKQDCYYLVVDEAY